MFVFPGAREEIIEDVLRKLTTENRAEAYEATSGANAGSKFVGVGFNLIRGVLGVEEGREDLFL